MENILYKERKITLIVRNRFYVAWLCMILFATSMQQAFAALPQNQKITLNLQNATIKEAFETIRKQSDYIFFFETGDVDTRQKISLQISSESINDILNQVLKGKGLKYEIKNKHIIIKPDKTPQPAQSSRQSGTINGVVTDEKGEPIIGANIMVKGTTNGTVTDLDGKFVIQASPGDILEISYIGYNPLQIKAGTQTSLSIKMTEDTQNLEEIVVVGYGTQKKSDLISAITSVRGKELAEQPVPRVDQLLRGRVAGMQVVQSNGTPGASSSIRIRGGNSLSASNEPLYVIDGFIDAGDLNSLNPNDIESIEVLKDATSTAIYGARGSNGVILITTKRGKEGKAQFDVEASYGWQKLPKKIDLLSTGEYASYLNKIARMNGTTVPYDDPSKVTGVDWQDELFRTAPVYNVNLSSSGGTEKIKYLISQNHFDQDGIMVGSGFNRTTLRTNVDAEVNPWFSLGTTVSLSREFSDISTLPSDYSLAVYGIGMSPIGTAFNPDGSYNYTESSRPLGRNPLAEALLPTDEKNTYYVLNNSYLQFKIGEHFTWRSTLGIKWNYWREDYFSPRKGSYQEKTNSAKATTLQTQDLLTEHTLTYTLKKEVHSFSALGGFTAQKGYDKGLSTEVSNFANDITGFYDLNSAQLKNSVKSGYHNWGYMSWLGRINYSYDNRYLLTAVARYDGSSRFSPGNKWAFFPSVSVGWRITEEDFMKSQQVVNDLKLRLSYGRVGNQAIDIYSTQSLFSSGSTILGGQEVVTYTPSKVPSKDLTWEKTDQFDAGIDFSFFNSVLTGSLDYYHKKTSDLLWEISVPSYIGQSTQLQNLGSLSNQGVELSLNASLINKKDFQWDMNFNISTNRSKVLSLGPDQEKPVGEHWGGYYSSILKVGSPVGLFYGQVYEGVLPQQDIDAGNLSARPGDPKFKNIPDDPNNSTVIGNANPDFFGGLGTTVAYKGISLNAFFQYSVGNDVMNLNSAYFLPGNANVNCYRELAEKMWTPENPDTDVARPGNSYIYSVDSRFVENGSFLRLSSLTLAYDLPRNLLQYIGLASARVYATGNNLFNICNYRGYDPEVSLYSTSPILKGYDWGQYPMNRSFSIGLKFTL